MSRHERLNRILAIVTDQGYLDVEEAVAHLDVSAATIRRDLDHLARQQLVTRTHGGAAAVAGSYDLPLGYKIARQAEAKRLIARAAAAMVPLGSSIALNGGTTTTEVARTLAARPDVAEAGTGAITVVTNALNIATELAVRPQIKIVVIGGVARPQSYELVGPLGASVLDQIRVDTAFIGVDAFDPGRGATAHHEGEAVVNRGLAERARRVVVVADSSKLGGVTFARICPTEQVDVLVTDADPGTALRAGFDAHGVHIVVADEQTP